MAAPTNPSASSGEEARRLDWSLGSDLVQAADALSASWQDGDGDPPGSFQNPRYLIAARRRTTEGLFDSLVRLDDALQRSALSEITVAGVLLPPIPGVELLLVLYPREVPLVSVVKATHQAVGADSKILTDREFAFICRKERLFFDWLRS